MASRPALQRVKEVLERGFADFYDAFADMDADQDGKVSQQDFQQCIKQLEGGEDLTGDQIDTAFNKCGVDVDGYIVYKDFHAAFMGKASRAATDTGGISSAVIPRAFEEVLMECKDAEGVQKFITVPATMNWTELLQKLKHKYGRAVTFMYEADGHSYTVNDERDFKQCWDSAEDAFLRANPVTPSAHLEAFIINIDPSKILGRAGGMRAGRKAHLQPKRVTLGEVRDERVSRPEGAARREAQRQEFDSQHQRIDDMLRKTGAGDSEPSSMRKKWDKLLHECASIDTKKEKTLSQENFKKALLKADPNMTPDQQGWYVKDADKNSSGEILYEKYCEQKKTGKSVREGEAVQNDTIRQLERQISQAFKDRYKTLQSAFKRLDEDKDGY